MPLLDDSRARWRRAPWTDLAGLARGAPILVIAPHPDDETIGCGGLIRQALHQGVSVSIAILTDGARSHPGSSRYDAPRLAALRRNETLDAANRLGLDEVAVTFFDEPDAALAATGPAADQLVDRLQRLITESGSQTVFVTWADDPHCDHQAAFSLACEAARRSALHPRLFAYPVWSWTIATPRSPLERAAVRLDIAAQQEAKRRALDCHASQLGRVIDDDPEGFSLTEDQLALFLQPFELFIEVAA